MFRLVLLILISVVIIGCKVHAPMDPVYSSLPVPETPTPTSTATVSGVTINWGVHNERLIVIETLTTFNYVSNDFFTFLKFTNQVEQLDGHPFYKRYIVTTLIINALNIYQHSITMWEPPHSSIVYLQLREMKDAELFRIKKFKTILSKLQQSLVSEDEITIKSSYKELTAWGKSDLNKKSSHIQKDILEELKIDSDEVNFQFKDVDEVSNNLAQLVD